ncbi:hypothetical protein BDP27DRAFT_371479 [Rhodocollybia butyracea]|uniref:Uncharacterized protein n=1 Tax=Rhodocollybia butyracea TaxID=206335 RepID=A0A9P5Q2J5_9AGAR|nr:hypothetical protein BDP27DRAFT_371479 [Rhodocollybia butyracea]
MDYYPAFAHLSIADSNRCWPQYSSRWPGYLHFPSSPSDNGSSASSDLSLTPPPRPQSLHVICNAPLIAPKPLPYHSPTFLKFELLPDLDEDLSHPPYTQRPSKRKREVSDESADFVLRKRRVTGTALVPASGLSLNPRKPRHHVHPYRAQK